MPWPDHEEAKHSCGRLLYRGVRLGSMNVVYDPESVKVATTKSNLQVQVVRFPTDCCVRRCPTVFVSFARQATGLGPGRRGTADSEAKPVPARFKVPCLSVQLRRNHSSDGKAATAVEPSRPTQDDILRGKRARYRPGPYPARCTGPQRPSCALPR